MVLRLGLESRLGIKLGGTHPVMTWLVEHAADVLSKYEVGLDGRTAYERSKGKPCTHEMVEFGERIRFKYSKGSRRQDEKMEGKWGRAIFWGNTGGREKPLWGVRKG